ncbi:hypothetical protein [Micromonospora nigra]|nr:hypothetical protein [Micromonospora nigra]
MRSLRIAATALIVCAALAACGGQEAGNGPTDPTPTGAPTVTDLPTPDPTGSVTPPTDPADPVDPTAPVSPPVTKRPASPSATAGSMLTGTVESGVEPGCLLLDGYLLLGGPRDIITEGARVTVTGRPEPGMLTTCQQGIPFLVTTAKRA